MRGSRILGRCLDLHGEDPEAAIGHLVGLLDELLKVIIT